MRRTLLTFSMLAGLASGTAASPADAASLAHGLLPSAKALLSAVNTATDAVLNEAAPVQPVQYYRRYRQDRRYGRRYSRRY